tara:strand:- start:26414 stop:26701 length:288 start_codon:yes stop_codon:yes gene_type:complete
MDDKYEAIETRFKMTTDHKLEMIQVKLEEIREKQDEVSETISKIKEALYGPDQGLYARIRDLEQWKSNMQKVIWMLTSTIIGMGGYILNSVLEKM